MSGNPPAKPVYNAKNHARKRGRGLIITVVVVLIVASAAVLAVLFDLLWSRPRVPLQAR